MRERAAWLTSSAMGREGINSGVDVSNSFMVSSSMKIWNAYE
jgi:hypothetical protein